MSQGLFVHVPSPSLSPYIKMFWMGEDKYTDITPIIPDGCIDVVLRCGGKLQSQINTYGSSTRYCEHGIAPDHRYLGIQFQPGQARHFIDIPAWQLTDTYCDLASPFISSLFPATNEPDPKKALNMVETQCFQWLSKTAPTAEFIDRLVNLLIQQPTVKLSSFCVIHGVSERQLQRQFKDKVGLTPKLFLRILRAQRVKGLFEQGQQTPLAQLALTQGYADQSHMQREIKLFFGQTPRLMLKKS